MTTSLRPTLHLSVSQNGTVIHSTIVDSRYEASPRGLLLFIRDTSTEEPAITAAKLGCSQHTLKNYHQGRQIPEHIVWRLAEWLRQAIWTSLKPTRPQDEGLLPGAEELGVTMHAATQGQKVPVNQALPAQTVADSVSRAIRDEEFRGLHDQSACLSHSLDKAAELEQEHREKTHQKIQESLTASRKAMKEKVMNSEVELQKRRNVPRGTSDSVSQTASLKIARKMMMAAVRRAKERKNAKPGAKPDVTIKTNRNQGTSPVRLAIKKKGGSKK